MPVFPGIRIRSNNVFGVTLDAPLTAGATVFNSLTLSDLPVVASDHAFVTLDPLRQFGDPEIVMVTIHTVSSTVATIQRGMFGTTPRSHPVNTLWAHAALNDDYVAIVTSGTRPTDQYEGQLIYEMDTDSYFSWNGTSWVPIGTGGGGGAATLGYAQSTTLSQLVTSTNSVDLTGLSVTVTVPAGRRIRITGSGLAQINAADNRSQINIVEGVTILNTFLVNHSEAAVNESLVPVAVISPSAGTHTYKLQGASPDAGNATFSGSVAAPTFILVEDITDSQTPFSTQNVPVGQLGFAVAPGIQAGIAGEVQVTGLSVNVAVPSGRSLRISTLVEVQSTADGDVPLIQIKEDGVVIQRSTLELGDAVNRSFTMVADVIKSPTAGAHTYIVTIQRAVGAGTLTVNGSAAQCYLLVEDITPTPSTAIGAPGSTLGYAEVTVGQAGITAAVDLTGLSTSVTVPAGRRLRISAFIQNTRTVVDGTSRLQIQEGATVLQTIDIQPNIGSESVEATGSVVLTPSAGTHTYKLTLSRVTGTGTTALVATTTNPAYILVEDITGAVWPSGSEVTVGMIASEPWTTYTPTLTQTGTVTKTVTSARYQRIGRTIHFAVNLAVTGPGGGGTAVEVGLPVAAAPSWDALMIGPGLIYDSSTAIVYNGNAAVVASLNAVAIWPSADGSPVFLGARAFTAAIAAGDLVRVSGTYEAAS